MNYKVILFYSFIKIENPETLMRAQRELCESINLKGRIIIAKEGINGTLEGTVESIAAYCKELKKDIRFKKIPIKESEGSGDAFPKLKVKVRDEIVTMGTGYIDPTTPSAPLITADELEEMFEKDEDFLILDLRNDYEIASGAFEKTIDLKLRHFRDFPKNFLSWRV